MIHMGLSLLTVALESGSHHIGTFPSLMNFVKDDMCKNLFWVGYLHVSLLQYNQIGKENEEHKMDGSILEDFCPVVF